MHIARLRWVVGLAQITCMAVPLWASASQGDLKETAAANTILEIANMPGGVIVHLGSGNGHLTSALGRSGKFLVHGLDRDPDAVRQARAYIDAHGDYGRTSIWQLRGKRLPYVDNMVNLIVVERSLDIAKDELQRVLAPGGVVMRRAGSEWAKHIKTWPDDIDQWTHFLHGPDNNAVARDAKVGPPRHLQWLADPIHLRTHENLNSVSAVVSAGGRIFYILDEGPTAAVTARPQWRLVARDAFNGVLLWKHDLGPWEGHFRLFRSGPPDIARRLVASAGTVFVTQGYGQEVVALDAATGHLVHTYTETSGAIEILHENQCLYVLRGNIDAHAWQAAARRYYPTPAPREKSVVALDAGSGHLLWKRAGTDTASILPATMAVANGSVFFQNTRQVVCLNAADGQPRWHADRPVFTTRLSWSTPTLVVNDNVVLTADGSTGGLRAPARRGESRVQWILSDQDIRKHPMGDVVALDANTGQRLWTGDSLQGFCSPGDVFVVDGRVWCGASPSSAQQKLDVARDLKTGAVVSRPTELSPAGGHTRCYRNKATENYLVLGGVGVEFVDVNDWSWSSNPWVRGTCQYGVMPCNGLLYVPSDSCACRPNARLHGFTAMAPSTTDDTPEPTAAAPVPQLEKGSAYGSVSSKDAPSDIDTWTTYRHDAERSGWTRATVGIGIHDAWNTALGGSLTSLTVGPHNVYVARLDAHAIYALDRDTGKIVWRRRVGGPVDSPPTVARGLVIFGCRDGSVYCLRTTDGALVWRYRAAPQQRLLVAQEQIESAWPVHGSVLVRKELVWFAAGRSSYLDDGIWLNAVQLETGQGVVSRRLDGRDAKTWEALTQKPLGRSVRNLIPGTLPDILTASQDAVFMRWTCFDEQGNIVKDVEPHLFSATGFLDGSWWHRTYWQYGTWMRGGFGGWPQAARRTPAGRILAITDDSIYGFGRAVYDVGNPEQSHAGHVGLIKDTYQGMGHIDYSQNPYRLYAAIKPGAQGSAKRQPAIQYAWTASVPILVRAMVRTDQTLWIAGPAAQSRNQGLAELPAQRPGQLCAVAPVDGKVFTTTPLDAAPVLDGLVAVAGQLFMACTDGTVISWAAP